MRERNMWIGEKGGERPLPPVPEEPAVQVEATEPNTEVAAQPLVVVEPVDDQGWQIGSLERSGKALDDLVPRTWPRSAR